MTDSAPPLGLPDIDQLWNYARPAETEAAFREILPRARLEATPGYLAELLTQIARTHSLRSQFDQAHALLDEVALLIPHSPVRAKVRYLLERGRAFNSAHRPADAGPLFREAWDVARLCGEHGLAVDAAHMLGICEPPDEALAWNHSAIEYAERCGDSGAVRWLGSLYNNTGWTHFDKGDYPRALELLQNADDWYRGNGSRHQIWVARYAVARVHRAMGRVGEALAAQQAVASEQRAAGEPDGYVLEEIAECLLALERVAEARPHFAEAHRLLSQDDWLRDHEPQRLARLGELGSAG